MNITYDNYLARITGEDFSVSGRVGVCQDEVYGSVCDANWEQEDADVICNNIGLGENFGEPHVAGILK